MYREREHVGTKLYIVTLRFGQQQRRVFLEGEAGEAGEARYRTALRELDAVGDACGEWTDFLPHAIRHFRKHGFVEVPH